MVAGLTGIHRLGKGQLSEAVAQFQPEAWVAPLVLGAVVFSLLSIFLFYLIFSLAVTCWLADCYQKRRILLSFPPFTPLLLLFVGLVMISILFSSDVVSSAKYLKKLVKLFSAFLIFTYVNEIQIESGLRWILRVLGASAIYGVLQLLWLKETSLINRIDGFMSHWMTFSGQLMMGTVCLAGYLLFLLRMRGTRCWAQIAASFLLFLLISAALILTFTRSAWIGSVGGLLVMLAILRLRWALVGGMAVVVIFLLLPAPFQQRFYSSFDLTDTTTRGRIELLKTGARLIQTHPWTGVGPRMVAKEALEYRNEKDLPDYLYQHFHNNLVQIAAEMGIPAALIWLGLWVWITRDFLRMRRAGKGQPFFAYLAVNGICVLVSVQLAGLLEYNFGDSEITILLLFFVTVPYAVDRRRSERGA